MGVLTCQISGVTYLTKNDRSIVADKTLEVRGVLTITIVDFAGTATFQRGQPIVVSDSVTGPFYRGFIQSDQRMKYGPASPAVDHVLTCFDRGKYYFDKGANTTNYTGWDAGDIVANFVINGQPGQEGATIAAALHRDSTQADFNTGILTNVVGASNVDDGDLELAPAGSTVLYSEETTADFATGTLTNCQATNNTLTPTTTGAIKMTCEMTVPNATGAITTVKVWSGARTNSSTNHIAYDLYIDPSSPQAAFSVDVYFSDGTKWSDLYVDPNINPDIQGQDPLIGTDLKGLADQGWYHRDFRLGFNKTISAIIIGCGGTQPGVYTAWFKNIILADAETNPINGVPFTVLTTFFGGTLNVNPPQQIQSYGYQNTFVTVVPTYDLFAVTADEHYGASTYRVTPSTSISSVSLLKEARVSWINIQPDTSLLVVKYSLDGGNSYTECTNNAMLPNLPAGLSTSGLSIQFLQEFYALAGASPEVAPVLEQFDFSSTPSYAATKADVVYSVTTAANWTAAGTTLTNTAQLFGDDLTLNGYVRNWDNGSDANQSFYHTGGLSTPTASQGIFNRSFQLHVPQGNPNAEVKSRMDFAGQWQNFIAEHDFIIPTDNVEMSFIYRTTGWQNAGNTFAYLVSVETANIFLGKGTNTSSGGGSFTQLAITTFGTPLQTGSWHHLKSVVSGNSHQIYLDDIQYLNVTDSSYTTAGYMGLRSLNFDSTAGLLNCDFDNFGVVAALSGTWASPNISLSAAGSYGTSIISWLDHSPSYNGQTNTNILVESTINGGTNWYPCTNGQPLQGITPGQSLSGVNLKIRVTLTTASASYMPAIADLVVRVLGQYPGSSGTRSTKPMGIDYVDRANQSGFGTASDGQTWTPTGTGTPAVASNALTITNTTGDFIELLGTRTGTDMDETTYFSLSASAIPAGLVLRYVDSTHYYKLQVSTTAISIIKRNGGTTTTLATTAVTLTTNAPYWLRFRIVGAGPINFYGKVWDASGATVEPTAWNVTALE